MTRDRALRLGFGPCALGLTATVLVAACTGTIDPTNRNGGSGPNGLGPGGGGEGAGAAAGTGGLGGEGPMGPRPSVEESCDTLDVGITPLRRLSRIEYDNTVHALLGDTTRPAESFVPDETLLGFAAGLNVSSLLVEQYQNSAETLARNAVSDVPTLLGCEPANAEGDACATGFVDRFAKSAYRRALEAEERDELQALYETTRSASGPQKALEIVVQAVLQSPQFLYRIEVGRPTEVPGVYQLSSYELATRLSYLLWQTMPDDDLFTAADQGRLDTVDGLETEARRMLLDDRSRQTIRSFHEQWLKLEELESTGKDETLYPGFDDALRESMREETLHFVEHVIFEGTGTVEELLTGSYSFVDDRLAGIYGVEGSGSGFAETDLDPTERSGLLTNLSVLSIHSKANQSSPVHRGKFVRERILCHELQPPPPGLIVVPPDLDPSLPTRERFAAHTEDEACAQCHQLTDPIGFGFEHYDAVGKYREMDGDFPVDATGEIVSTRDIDGPFDGAIELGERLAQSEQVQDCVAGNWFVFAFGRSIMNDLDVCSRAKIYEAFESSGYNIRELLVSLVTTDAFRYRRDSLEGEE